MGLDINVYKTNKLKKDQNPNDVTVKLTSDIAYFRKVNFLTKWVSDSVIKRPLENCEMVELKKKHLRELKIRTELVLSTINRDKVVAKTTLPTEDGFFYGSVEYDDTYFRDVKQVKEFCDEVLEKINFKKESILFCADW